MSQKQRTIHLQHVTSARSGSNVTYRYTPPASPLENYLQREFDEAIAVGDVGWARYVLAIKVALRQ